MSECLFLKSVSSPLLIVAAVVLFVAAAFVVGHRGMRSRAQRGQRGTRRSEDSNSLLRQQPMINLSNGWIDRQTDRQIDRQAGRWADTRSFVDQAEPKRVCLSDVVRIHAIRHPSSNLEQFGTTFREGFDFGSARLCGAYLSASNFGSG